MKKWIFSIIAVICIVLSASAETTVCTRDSFFPEAGNCGYDVEDYQLDMEWDDKTDEWSVREVITFTVLWDVDEIRFNFRPAYEFTELTIDGAAVDHEQNGDDLKIRYDFDHDTRYRLYAAFHGPLNYGLLFDPDGAQRRENGAFCMLGEPADNSRYFICNDHPKDKATFHYSITVPADRDAAGVGRLLQIEEADGTVIRPDGEYSRPGNASDAVGKIKYSFETEEPMAPYLFTVCCGDFDMKFSSDPDGKQRIDFIDPVLDEKTAHKAIELSDRNEEFISFLEEFFGPYPFSARGSIVTAEVLPCALETQTRPIYTLTTTTEIIFVHELAHQWIGDLISIADWSDVWIKEGGATYMEALWEKHTLGQEAFENRINEFYRNAVLGYETTMSPAELESYLSKGWNIAPDREFDMGTAARVYRAFTGSEFPEEARTEPTITYENWIRVLTAFDGPTCVNHDSVTAFTEMTGVAGYVSYYPETHVGPKQITQDTDSMYGVAPYDGAALVYHALNRELGDEGFAAAMQYLLNKYRFGTVSTEQFIETMNEFSGRDLSELILSRLYYDPENLPELRF